MTRQEIPHRIRVRPLYSKVRICEPSLSGPPWHTAAVVGSVPRAYTPHGMYDISTTTAHLKEADYGTTNNVSCPEFARARTVATRTD